MPPSDWVWQSEKTEGDGDRVQVRRATPMSLTQPNSSQSDHSYPGGGMNPQISLSTSRLKAVAVLSRPDAAIAW